MTERDERRIYNKLENFKINITLFFTNDDDGDDDDDDDDD